MIEKMKRNKKVLLIVASVLLGLSVISSGVLYGKYSSLYDRQYVEVKQARETLVESIDEHILMLKRIRFSKNFDAYLLHESSSAMLQSILGHYYTTVRQMDDVEAGDVDELQYSYNRLWEVMTEVSSVETQEELDQHIKEVTRELERFKRQAVAPNVK